MNKNNSLDNLLKEGHHLLERGQYEEGLEVFQQADSQFPDVAKVKYAIGKAYFRLEQYEECIQYMNLALQLQQVYPLALVRSGMAYNAINQNELANEDFEAVLKITPQSNEDWRARGIAFDELKYSKQALYCFQKALKISKQDHYSWNRKGRIYFGKRQHIKALDCYLRALHIIPEKQISWANCGFAYTELGLHSDALKCLYKSLELRNNNLEAYYAVACCFYNEKQYLKSIEVCDKALSIKSNDYLFLCFKGAAFIGLENYYDALLCYDCALEINPDLQEAKEQKYKLLSAINNQKNNRFKHDQIYIDFLLQILHSIENGADQKQVYLLFQENLDKLNLELAQTMNAFIENISLLTLEEKQGFAYTFFIFGNLLQQFVLGNKKDNLEISKIAYTFFSNVFKKDYPKNYAIAQLNLGLIYLETYDKKRQENIELAIACFKSAQKIITKNNYPLLWAQAQHNLGLIYKERISGDRKENIELAIAAHTAALTKYTEDNHSKEWADAQTNLGCCYELRIVGDRKENIELAIAAHTAALRVFTEKNYPRFWGMTRSNLGSAYLSRVVGDKSENRELAISNFTSALKVITEEKLPLDWARRQNDLGVAYRKRIVGDRKENIELAIVAHTSALRVLTEKNYPQFWAGVHVNLCACYSTIIAEGIQGNQNNIELAITSCKQALQLFTEKDFPQDWALAQHNLGLCYVRRIAESKTKNIELAIEAYTAALKIRTPQFNPVNCLNTSRSLGSLHFKEGNWQQAIKAYSQAIEAVEQSREWAANEENKQEVISNAIEVYQNIVQCCINLGQNDKAIEYVERGKARNLIDLLSTRDLYPNGDIPQSILNSLHNLRRNITIEQKRLRQLRISNQNNFSNSFPEDTRSLSANYQQNLAQNRQRLNSLFKSLNFLIETHILPVDPSFELTQIKPISFSKIRQTLSTEQTVIVEWFIGDDTLSAFIVISGQDAPIHFGYSEEQYNALVDSVNEYYSTYRQRDKKWDNNLPQLLASLAQYLQLEDIIEQIKEIIPDCNQLILVPHRWLHLLPIHTLPLSDGRCLLDLFPNGVSYAPSVQLLELTQKRSRTKLSNLFAVQNPTEDLEFTNLEVNAIRSQFTPNDDVLVGEAATKEALTKERLASANLAHFSSHGYFNFENPELSALLMAGSQLKSATEAEAEQENNNQQETKRYLPSRKGGSIDLEKCLTLGEIFGLDLRNCRLVTLSACETGITDFRSLSDEYIGLPSGFLFAGSPSVVSSLWAVSDISTTFLMIKFYQNLEKIDSVPVALNQAQLWLRSSTKEDLKEWLNREWFGKVNLNRKKLFEVKSWVTKLPPKSVPFANPYYWAAFCAIGS